MHSDGVWASQHTDRHTHGVGITVNIQRGKQATFHQLPPQHVHVMMLKWGIHSKEDQRHMNSHIEAIKSNMEVTLS